MQYVIAKDFDVEKFSIATHVSLRNLPNSEGIVKFMSRSKRPTKVSTVFCCSDC